MKNKNMWWKVYWWLTVVVTVIVILSLAFTDNSFLDLIAFVNWIIAVAGLYSFLFKKKIFHSNFWLYFFWFNIIYDLAYLAYGLAPNDPIIKNLAFLDYGNAPAPPIIYLIFSLLNIPMLYAFYKLARPSRP